MDKELAKFCQHVAQDSAFIIEETVRQACRYSATASLDLAGLAGDMGEAFIDTRPLPCDEVRRLRLAAPGIAHAFQAAVAAQMRTRASGGAEQHRRDDRGNLEGWLAGAATGGPVLASELERLTALAEDLCELPLRVIDQRLTAAFRASGSAGRCPLDAACFVQAFQSALASQASAPGQARTWFRACAIHFAVAMQLQVIRYATQLSQLIELVHLAADLDQAPEQRPGLASADQFPETMRMGL